MLSMLEPIFVREEVIKAIRSFFEQKKFHEVFPPILNYGLPLEPNLQAFQTTWDSLDGKKSLYLPFSPEAGIKKMLALGIGNCFAVSKSFRNQESVSRRHNPEFFMLEWYRQQATYDAIMEDIAHLLIHIKKHIDTFYSHPFSPTLTYGDTSISLEKPFEVFSLVDLFSNYAHISNNILLGSEELLFERADKKGYSITNATWSQIFDQIFLNEIETKLPKHPFFLTDFPARISPLCAIKTKNPFLAQRFEFYAFGIELANGNTEKTDAKGVQSLWETERTYRKKHGIPTPPMDTDFLKALDTMSSKSYAGAGLGVDRLAMILSGSDDIKNVEPFVL